MSQNILRWSLPLACALLMLGHALAGNLVVAGVLSAILVVALVQRNWIKRLPPDILLLIMLGAAVLGAIEYDESPLFFFGVLAALLHWDIQALHRRAGVIGGEEPLTEVRQLHFRRLAVGGFVSVGLGVASMVIPTELTLGWAILAALVLLSSLGVGIIRLR